MKDSERIKNLLIVTGGYIDVDFSMDFVKSMDFQYIIGVDKGINFLFEIGINPDEMMGDFDSADNGIFDYFKKRDVICKCYSSEKDDSDTRLGMLRAIELNPENVYVLGATGSRLDHVVTNLFNLLLFRNTGINCVILDKHNKIYLAQNKMIILKKNLYGNNVSLIPLSDEITGLSIKGFKYELEDYCLNKDNCITLSNEIADSVAAIEFMSGDMAIIESRD